MTLRSTVNGAPTVPGPGDTGIRHYPGPQGGGVLWARLSGEIGSFLICKLGVIKSEDRGPDVGNVNHNLAPGTEQPDEGWVSPCESC